MKQKTLKTEISIYLLFILIALFSFTFEAGAQTVTIDKAGNYRQISASNDTTGAKYRDTGKTFTTAKGEKFPVMISSRGKLFVIRTSKTTGNQYRQYLKL
jgi:hypothetical protein